MRTLPLINEIIERYDMNTTGQLFRLTTFGESHGEAIGGVVDGMPAGVEIDMALVEKELKRRRPGQSNLTSTRNEADEVRFLSGIFEGKSTGAPIAFIVENNDQRSSDYEHLRNIYRPSHADYVYEQKYGIRDFRGGGRSSARVTLSRIVAGALAKMVLRRAGIGITAYTCQIGDIVLEHDYTHYDLTKTDDNDVRCPDAATASRMISLLKALRNEGDTIGGAAACIITGCPAGLGEPEFGKLNAALGAAMLSINAVKAFQIGAGFDVAALRGSRANDIFVKSDDGKRKVRTLTNHSGGIQGGISNGEDIYFSVAFKPIPTIMREQETVDRDGNKTIIEPRGRHDVCAVPRAIPIIESMAAMTILDHWLMARISNIM